MSWTFNPASGRTPERWILPADKQDFSGLDPYQPYLFPIIGAPTTWEDFPTPYIEEWQSINDSLGVPGAIGETACHEHLTQPLRKAQWIREFFDWCKAQGHIAFCYFNADKPGDTAPAMLLNSSEAVLDTWAGILEENQAGVVK